MRRFVAILVLCLGLFGQPMHAYASDIDYVESLGRGIETLKGNATNENVSPESDFNESYEPEPVILGAAPAEQPTDTQGNIEWVTDSFNSVPINSQTNKVSLVRSITAILGGTSSSLGSGMKTLLILPAIGICFMWWGLRKALRMIMSGWRKGNASI